MRTARLAVGVLLAAGLAGAVHAADPEMARRAKALFFDRQYAEARTAWQAVFQASRKPEADQAAFWIARASESLGESERAFKEYGEFLARRPDQPAEDERRPRDPRRQHPRSRLHAIPSSSAHSIQIWIFSPSSPSMSMISVGPSFLSWSQKLSAS